MLRQGSKYTLEQIKRWDEMLEKDRQQELSEVVKVRRMETFLAVLEWPELHSLAFDDERDTTH